MSTIGIGLWIGLRFFSEGIGDLQSRVNVYRVTIIDGALTETGNRDSLHNERSFGVLKKCDLVAQLVHFDD